MTFEEFKVVADQYISDADDIKARYEAYKLLIDSKQKEEKRISDGAIYQAVSAKNNAKQVEEAEKVLGEITDEIIKECGKVADKYKAFEFLQNDFVEYARKQGYPDTRILFEMKHKLGLEIDD